MNHIKDFHIYKKKLYIKNGWTWLGFYFYFFEGKMIILLARNQYIREGLALVAIMCIDKLPERRTKEKISEWKWQRKVEHSSKRAPNEKEEIDETLRSWTNCKQSLSTITRRHCRCKAVRTASKIPIASPSIIRGQAI